MTVAMLFILTIDSSRVSPAMCFMMYRKSLSMRWKALPSDVMVPLLKIGSK